MNVTLVYKPASGFDVRGFSRALKRGGHAVEVLEKRNPAVRAALGRPAELIAVAGGDGTVAEVIRAMPDRRIPILVLPVGTANNIARSFGIARDVENSLRSLPAMKPRRLDLFLARGAFGAHVLVESAAVGSIAAAQRKACAIPAGQDRLAAAREAIAQTLARAEPITVELDLDGKTTTRRCLGLEILNITRIGPALSLLAHADPGDAMLDVVCIESREAFLRWLDDTKASAAPVTSIRAREVKLLTCAPESPPDLELESGLGKGADDEARSIYRRADCRSFAGAGSRSEDGGYLTQTRHHGDDVLSLEGEVWRP